METAVALSLQPSLRVGRLMDKGRMTPEMISIGKGLPAPTLRESVLFALVSYFATRIRSTCTNRSARCISGRQDKKGN
jgi:hypothetical protein